MMGKQMWSIYTMEHYSAQKRNEILIYITMWIEVALLYNIVNVLNAPGLFKGWLHVM